MHASESFTAQLQKFVDEHERRDLQATAAYIDPVLVPGHEQHVAAARELSQHFQPADISMAEQMALNATLDRQERHEHAVSAIHHLCNHLDSSLDKHRHLQHLAVIRNVDISKMDGYDQWVTDARDFRARATDIVQEPEVYDCGFTPEIWQAFREHLADLDTAIGDYSFFTRSVSLYLPPLPHEVPASEEALHAYASYREVRESWHEHIVSGDGYDPHPYEDVRSKIFNAMESLANSPDLPDDAKRTISTLVGDYNNYCFARSDVETYLQDTNRILDANRTFKEDIKNLGSQNIVAEDIEGYSAWQEKTANLTKTGEELISYASTAYGPYLKHHPDLRDRLKHCLDDLKDALDNSLPSRTQDIIQNQQMDQHRSVSRGMRI